MSATEQQTDQQAEPIEVKEAMICGRQAIMETVEIEGNPFYNLRLEEARHDAERGEWLITFGYDLATREVPGTALPAKNALAGLFPPTQAVRVHRVIALNDRTGKFLEVRRRESVAEQ